jgi:hypothetical protein
MGRALLFTRAHIVEKVAHTKRYGRARQCRSAAREQEKRFPEVLHADLPAASQGY